MIYLDSHTGQNERQIDAKYELEPGSIYQVFIEVDWNTNKLTEEQNKKFVFSCFGRNTKPTIVNQTYRFSKEEYLRRVFRDIVDLLMNETDDY